MGEHHRLIPDNRSRSSRYQTVRSRSQRSRSRTVRSRAARYQLPAGVSGRAHESVPTGVGRARHRLARARHNLARAGIRVIRPRAAGRLPTALEALLPWAPVLVGIGILIGFIVTVVVLPASSPPQPGFPELAPPAAPDPDQAPPPDEGVGQAPRYVVPGRYDVRYSPTPEPPPPPAPDPGPELTGKYRVDEVYSDVFIGMVIIVNESDEAAAWTVELAYGRDVGELNTFWVDGTPQPDLERVDDRYVFTSAVDVPGESWVVLKVHYDRFGRDIAPEVCLVNGEECVIHR